MDAQQSAENTRIGASIVRPASRHSGRGLRLFCLLALCLGLLCFALTPLSAAAAPAGKKAVKSGLVAKAKVKVKDERKSAKKAETKKAEKKHVAKKDEPKKADKKRAAKKDTPKKDEKKRVVKKDEPKKADASHVAQKDAPDAPLSALDMFLRMRTEQVAQSAQTTKKAESKKAEKKRVAQKDKPDAPVDPEAPLSALDMFLRFRTEQAAQAAHKDAPKSADDTTRVAKTARARAEEPRPPEKVILRSGEEGPYVKRRASFDENTSLANVLADRLGLEVREDPRYSGGLYIAPPSMALGHADRAMDLLANLPLGKPIAEEDITSVSSGFGNRQDPFKKRRRAFHEGIDFRAKRGVKVRATANGRVVNSGYSPSYGENIILSHGEGYETMFAHLSKRLVKVGDEVAAGDLIGLVGSTGRSTGAHLHYEVRYEGAPIDPTDYAAADPQTLLQKQ